MRREAGADAQVIVLCAAAQADKLAAGLERHGVFVLRKAPLTARGRVCAAAGARGGAPACRSCNSENRRLVQRLDEMRALIARQVRAGALLRHDRGAGPPRAGTARHGRAHSLRTPRWTVLDHSRRPEAFPRQKAGQRRPRHEAPCPLPQGSFPSGAQPGPACGNPAHAAGFNKGKRVRHLWKNFRAICPSTTQNTRPTFPQAKREAYYGLPRQVQFCKECVMSNQKPEQLL